MPPKSLAELGWSAARERAFAPHAADGLCPGRVVLEHNHVFRVLTAAGEQLAESAGRMKHRASGRPALPVVGDWIALRPDSAGGRGQIRDVLPRATWFSRKAAGRETKEQIVAANIDTVFIVFGLDLPVNPAAIERYLVVARHSGARPIVMLNKTDLTEDLDRDLAEAKTAAGEADVAAVSAKTDAGCDGVLPFLGVGITVALIGPSGAGKSSIVNRLAGRDVLATGDVRDWDGRGRHTSVHRQLVVLESGGMIIDTPGMRELQLWDTTSVADSFADVANLAAACRFRDCQHDREPGCAVKTAAETGRFDRGRYESYLKLQTEQHAIAARRTERSQLEAKRIGRMGSKAMRSIKLERERNGR